MKNEWKLIIKAQHGCKLNYIKMTITYTVKHRVAENWTMKI